MIINEQKSDIEVIGDITEFKSSIDPKNLEFITTLLSSNLYSAPERSFIREIVSNAWDSQVEANTTDIPIIIKIEEKEETITSSYRSSYERWSGIGDITIRDFGTGLSPDRFNSIYRNIGSSTKRESNAYHGAFGIGHLSGFSCSDTMYITSYYEGNCYEYIGIKDANTIVYTLVSTTPTTEKSGLEVTLKNVVLSKYRKALIYISFFPNVFLEDNNPDITCNINNIKIKKHTDFWVASIGVKDKLLLGNVLYPLNVDELNFTDKELNGYQVKDIIDFIYNLRNTGLVFKFDIGELSVTPNRENIIYTKECNSKIIDKIIKVKKEVDNIILNKAKEDFTDIIQYTDTIRENKSFDFFNEKITSYNYYSYPIAKNVASHLTYKGKDLCSYNNLLYYLTNDLTYCTKCIVNDKVYSVNSSTPLKYRNKCNLTKNSDRSIIILKKDLVLGKYLKEYLVNNYNYYIVLYPLSLQSIKDSIKYTMRLDTFTDTTTVDFIIQEIINYLYNKGTVIDFTTDQDFLDYKEARKEEVKNNKKHNIVDNKEVIVYTYHNAYCSAYKKTFSNLKKAIEDLKREKRGIVLIDRDTTDTTKEIILNRGFLPVFVRKEARDSLKDCSFTVELDWILHKDPMLSYIKTLKAVFELGQSTYNSLRALWVVVSLDYKEDIEKILKKRVIIDNFNRYYYEKLVNDYGEIDESFEKRLLKIKDFIVKYKDAVEILEDAGITISDYSKIHDNKCIGLISKVLLKQKSFRINNTAYNYIKSNKLINILCKK